MKANGFMSFLVAVHFLSLGCLVMYGLHRLWFIFNWMKIKKQESSKRGTDTLLSFFPVITVQLPLFNERFVAARLIDAATGLNWPKDLLEIQILDDSDDETRHLVDQKAAQLQKKGFDIRVIRRKERTGYKAGALSEGLNQAKGEFIAIFDADFLPEKDFLIQTMGPFKDPSVGMVQARWSFLNKESSWLTAVQSILIGHHFDIEHRVRYEKNYFFNFNGTAGVWRKRCIVSSGSWQSDTVTEDLDLSYRAQLSGWRFVYLQDVSVGSELPATMGSFLRQQQRWATGSTQTAIKLIPGIIGSSYSWPVKREALFHLLSNICWLMGFFYILTLYPALRFRMGIGPHQIIFYDLPLFMTSCGAILVYFFIYLAKTRKTTLLFLPLVPLLCIGLTPSIALELLVKGFRKGGMFQRTPKFGFKGRTFLRSRLNFYRQINLSSFILNSCFTLYTLLPVLFSWQRETWLAIPFLVLFPLSFMLVMIHDVVFVSMFSGRR